jgi:hypothetical protein
VAPKRFSLKLVELLMFGNALGTRRLKSENWQIRLCEFVGIFFTQEYFITRCLIYKFSVKMVLCYNLDAFLKALVKLSFNYYLLGVSHFHSRYWTWRHDREYQIILMLIL